MKNIVLGTAGHIDHGKTSLVKVLTGIDTDTLIEEQKRGITVNLGFSYLPISDELTVGIVDVPGHEKLIKNMLAGVCGIDLILLVVAADDGIMPQTREHFEIIKFLGVKNILTVITKTDLASETRIEEVKKEVTKEFGLSEFVLFSIKDESAKPKVIDKITKMIDKRSVGQEDEMFRMAVDRVFNVKGHGVVVTGSSQSGEVRVGDELVLLPSKTKVKVKGIQSFGKQREVAYKHMRVAINISGVKLEDVTRGQVLATPNSLFSSDIIDVKFKTSSDLQMPLRHLEEVKFYYLANELKARIKFFDQKELGANKEIFGQLLLDEPLYAYPKDFGIIRKVNPSLTVAGIEIVKPKGEFANRKDTNYANALKAFHTGDITDTIRQYVSKNKFCSFVDLQVALNLQKVKSEIIDEYLTKSNVLKINKKLILKQDFESISQDVVKYIEDYHKAHPTEQGVKKAIVQFKLNYSDLSNKEWSALISSIDGLKAEGDIIFQKDFKPSFSKEEQDISKRIIQFIDECGFMPPKIEEILRQVRGKDVKRMYFSLIKQGALIKIADDICLSKARFDKMISLFDKYFDSNSVLGLPDAKAILNTSRKYLVAYLEYCDKIGYTRRVENGRVKK